MAAQCSKASLEAENSLKREISGWGLLFDIKLKLFDSRAKVLPSGISRGHPVHSTSNYFKLISRDRQCLKE